MAIRTIEEGLALYSLGWLSSDAIPDLALLFLSEGCDVLEMAALAGSLAIEHPADRRAELERAIRLVGREFPGRIYAARTLRRLYAQHGVAGVISLRQAAALIKEVFQTVEAELPPTGNYIGDSFDIATLIGLYYSYDDVAEDDFAAIRELDRELLAELRRLGDPDS